MMQSRRNCSVRARQSLVYCFPYIFHRTFCKTQHFTAPARSMLDCPKYPTAASCMIPERPRCRLPNLGQDTGITTSQPVKLDQEIGK